MFQNNAISVNKRLGFCLDLNALNGTQVAEKDLVRLNRKKGILRQLIRGEMGLTESDVYLASPHAAKMYIDHKKELINAEKDEFKKSEMILNLEGFADIERYRFFLDRKAGISIGRANLLSQDHLSAENISKLNEHTLSLSTLGEVASQAKQLSQEWHDIHKQYKLDQNEVIKEINAKYLDRTQEIDNLLSSYIAEKDSLLEQSVANHGSIDYATRIKDLREKIEDQKRLRNELIEIKKNERLQKLNKLYDEYKANEAMAQSLKKELAENIISQLKEQSQATETDAQDWIDNHVEITKAVEKKIKKTGGDKDSFIQDLKDFYVLTNGRMGKIRIDTKNHERAYANDIDEHSKIGYIMLDNSFKKRTLWHELAHHLEADEVLVRTAKEYIKSRSLDGGDSHKLSILTGNSAFKSYERAYKTDMFSHYAAKIYDDDATELFSMGVDSFADNDNLIERLAADPETIKFVMASLMKPKDEMNLLNKQLRSDLLEQEKHIELAVSDNSADLFKGLAGKVSFTASSDDSWLASGDKAAFDDAGFQMVGYINLPDNTKYALMKGNKVSSIYNKRNKKGFYALMLSERQVNNKNAGSAYHYVSTHYQYNSTIRIQSKYAIGLRSEDMDAVKVMLLVHHYVANDYMIYNGDTDGVLGAGYLTPSILDQVNKIFINAAQGA